RFFVQVGRLSDSLELPRRDVRVIPVVAQRFAVGRLALFAKMPATRFAAVQGVERQQLTELEVVGDTARILERLIEVVRCARPRYVVPELFAQARDPLECAP